MRKQIEGRIDFSFRFIFNGYEYLVASLDALANPLVEGIESGTRMEDTAGDFAIAHEDAAVKTVIDSVPWLEHRTELGNRGVDAYILWFLALGAIWVRGEG